MVMYRVVAQFPGQSAKHADYCSGSPIGDIVEDHGDGQTSRPERVLDTGIDIEFEGRLCFGERTIRHWAALMGMVDGWRVQRMMIEAQAVTDDRDLLSRELAESRAQVANLMELQREPVTEVFVATDGGKHASAGAAEEASRKLAGLAPKALVGVRPLSIEETPA